MVLIPKPKILDNSIMLYIYTKETYSFLDEYINNKPTLINVWSINCEPCLKEIPVLKELAKQNGDIQFIFINIDSKNEFKKVKAKIEEYEIENKSLLDFSQVFVSSILPNAKVPATLIINNKKEIIKLLIGFRDENLKEINQELQKLNR
ncbi:MAG: TlpA disulfide reductase family protein [Leptospiraceae bacterium]|nr:TlpA disulfide reductase family protein [Leptospiraceae bacterium]